VSRDERCLALPIRYAARRLAALAAVLFAGAALASADAHASSTYAEIIDSVQPKIVKIYGAGGFQGLEAYQSGFLISADGFILTVWSYVLDTDYITVHLNDGRKLKAEVKNVDPKLELAILKIDVTDAHYFDIDLAADAQAGTRVLAFSNLYGVATGNEPASVQHGVVSVKTRLEARRGVFETPYRGSVYVLDAVTNNPGAAGGALVNLRGELLGMLGKELRNAQTNTWLNYAIPVAELRQTVKDIMAGKFVASASSAGAARPKADEPLKLRMLGIVLVPDVLERTPPFVDEVRSGSPAAQAGMRPDDLILFINGDRLIQSCNALEDELQYIDRDDEVRITVIRGQELLEFVLKAN
jgi:serine protease Do